MLVQIGWTINANPMRTCFFKKNINTPAFSGEVVALPSLKVSRRCAVRLGARNESGCQWIELGQY